MKQSFIETQPTQTATTLSRLPSLDGWRAVSILMVLAFHSTWAAGFPNALIPAFRSMIDGDLGVRFFFVISGFLITWLMILEVDRTGAVGLQDFYIRRCLRILPVYFTFLCVLGGLQLFSFFKQSSASWIGNLTFTRNFIGNDPISGHLWSLSVEEQFYLIWPTVFLLSGSGRNVRSIMLVLIFAILLAPMFRGISFGLVPAFFKPLFCYNSFFMRFDSLAFGCVSAVVLARKRKLVEECLKARPGLVAAVALTLVFIPYVLAWYLTAMIPLVSSLQALGFSILLLHSVVAPRWNFYRVLNWTWVRQIGILSYSLYIWQQLFWTPPEKLGLRHVWWMGLWIIPLFGVAAISYYALEQPLLKLRNRYRKMKLA